MAIRVILEMHAKPGLGDVLVSALKSTLSRPRAFEGCISIEVLQNSNNSDNLLLLETWKTHVHFEKCLAWRRERSDIDRCVDFFSETPDIRYFNLTDA